MSAGAAGEGGLRRSAPPLAGLVRGLGLLQATAANMLEMIGIGPFITIPIILQAMNGPQAMLGWLVGACVAVCDGLCWAELGAAMPGSGGPYLYLQRAYGPDRLGRLMSFLYIWQTMICAPLSIASGAVGFAMYARYLLPGLLAWQQKVLAMSVCFGVTLLLYRDIRSVGRLSVVMWAVVMATAIWMVVSGLLRLRPGLLVDFPPGAFSSVPGFVAGLGSATLIAMYSYGGYFNVCLFGGEVRDPGRTIPRSVLIAIGLVALLYVLMSVTVIGVVPWREAIRSSSVVSIFMERIYGSWAGTLVTLLILWTSFGSVFAIMLGYSRVPYAAAADGRFFSVFARLHPTRRFPQVSLLSIGVASALACWVELEALIKALLVIQILIQYLAQVLAVTLIRRNHPELPRPFRMIGYPLPSLLALAGWLYILISTGWRFILGGLGLGVLGAATYLLRARRLGEWPFATGGEG
jgi:amino acid transporter